MGHCLELKEHFHKAGIVEKSQCEGHKKSLWRRIVERTRLFFGIIDKVEYAFRTSTCLSCGAPLFSGHMNCLGDWNGYHDPQFVASERRPCVQCGKTIHFYLKCQKCREVQS